DLRPIVLRVTIRPPCVAKPYVTPVTQDTIEHSGHTEDKCCPSRHQSVSPLRMISGGRGRNRSETVVAAGAAPVCEVGVPDTRQPGTQSVGCCRSPGCPPGPARRTGWPSLGPHGVRPRTVAGGRRPGPATGRADRTAGARRPGPRHRPRAVLRLRTACAAGQRPGLPVRRTRRRTRDAAPAPRLAVHPTAAPARADMTRPPATRAASSAPISSTQSPRSQTAAAAPAARTSTAPSSTSGCW
ncbi:MAG: hypothetical protein QOK26_3465, partial [Pseudonocardiales bacterium]|nr:hypothetical protein [Pseudonocardiales bacterium]